MTEGNKFAPWALLVVLFVVLQVVFVVGDTRETPRKTAVEFIKAYYALDQDLSSMVCEDLQADEGPDAASQFIELVDAEAQQLGHNLNYMRSQLIHYHLTTVSKDNDHVHMHLTGERKRMIHPLFTLVGRFFSLGETYEVEKTIELIREEGRWKVCGEPFTPAEAKEIYGRSA